MPNLPKGYSQAAVEKALREHVCPTSFHVVRTRFLGSIATPGPSAPLEAVKDLWGGTLPAVESIETLNRIIELLVMGLWNDLTRHQKRSEPFRLARPEVAETRDGLARIAQIRSEELDGFAEGLFGAADDLELPGRANRGMDQLGEVRAMFASVHQVATDESIEAEAKQLAETFRSVRELTRIAEKEIHEVVIACTKARQAAMPGSKRRTH